MEGAWAERVSVCRDGPGAEENSVWRDLSIEGMWWSRRCEEERVSGGRKSC